MFGMPDSVRTGQASVPSIPGPTGPMAVPSVSPQPETLPAKPPPLQTLPGFDPRLVRVAVTTRAGGVSAGRYASLNLGFHVGDAPQRVLENRSRVAAALGITLDEMVFCQQVHDRAVTVVGEADRSRGARTDDDAVPATDALITTSPGVALVVMVADCVPIVLHDPVAGVLACVHAGWRGVVRGAVPAAVQAMRRLRADPPRVVAGIGPAIGADIYQVGDDVADQVRDVFGDRAAEVLRPDGTGAFLFDLVGAARMQLLDAGVDPQRVHESGMVTGPGTPFYSHRQEGPCGRFAVVARLLAKVDH